MTWSELHPTSRQFADKMCPHLPQVTAEDWEALPAGVLGTEKRVSVASRNGGKIVGWATTNGDGSFRSGTKGASAVWVFDLPTP